MSKWEDHDLTNQVVDVLGNVGKGALDHHFGRPYMTAYQLALELQLRHPETVEALDKPIGGAGVGQETSLAQYLANELSKLTKSKGSNCPVEGAFLDLGHVKAMTFAGPDKTEITSSLTGTGYPLSLYRLR